MRNTYDFGAIHELSASFLEPLQVADCVGLALHLGLVLVLQLSQLQEVVDCRLARAREAVRDFCRGQFKQLVLMRWFGCQ